jgi:hypothetical protein
MRPNNLCGAGLKPVGFVDFGCTLKLSWTPRDLKVAAR